MSSPTVRAFPVYYRGKKIAEAFENDFGVEAGRTPLFGADGLFAFTKGAIMTDLSISYIQPVKQTSVTMMDDCLAQNDVDIGVPIGGKYYVVSMAILSNKLKANTEKGTLEGNLSLKGGNPIVNSF